MAHLMTPRRHPVAIPVARIESNEEIQDAMLAAKRFWIPVNLAPKPERPVERPPVAMLCILDDGKAEGEWVRLRADRHVIGRTEGEVRIPHDAMISSVHAEIVREKAKRGYYWVLRDLGSTNGTWVRIGTCSLRHGAEIMIGRGRYLFDSGEMAAAPASPDPKTTRPWRPDSGATLPALVEVGAAGLAQRFVLAKDEYWIGRDPSCAIVRHDDAFASPKHARLRHSKSGRWHIDNNKSLNGLWYRVSEPIILGPTCHFRLGEQRFLFRAL